MLVSHEGSPMALTQHQLEDFHRFATEQISRSGDELSWPALFDLWRLNHPAANEQAEIYAALDESLTDMQHGRHRPARTVLSELGEKYRVEE